MGSPDPPAGDLEVLAQLRQFAEAEISGDYQPAQVSMGPFTAYQLIGMIQLACRHPQASEQIKDTGRRIVGALQPLFDGPAAESIDRGWQQ